MRAVQDEGHMRAGLGERSIIRVTDAAGRRSKRPASADPLSRRIAAREVHAAVPVNATEYVQIRMAVRRQVEAE